MNEQDFIQQLRKKAEKTPVPESLSPEQIASQLNRTSKPKNRYQQPWIQIAAAFALLAIVSGSVWGIRQSKKSQINMDSAASNDLSMEAQQNAQADSDEGINENTPAKSRIATPNSYQQLYQILADLSVHDMYFDAVQENQTEAATGNAGDDSAVSQDLRMEADAFSDTNTQVDTVAEADIVKTDGHFIYSCFQENGSYAWNAISIANAEQGTLTACSTISSASISEEIGCTDFFVQELYLLENKLLVLCEGTIPVQAQADPEGPEATADVLWTRDNTVNTYILTYDVSNPMQPIPISTLKQEGYYESSRLTNGCLYTFTTKWVNVPERFSGYEEIVPAAQDKRLSCQDIYLPKCPDASCYQLITGMQLDDPSAFTDSKAILSGNGIYYVSKESIYFAQPDWNDGAISTEILKFRYEDGSIQACGSVTVEGYLFNQFSMDEYNGYLRVVTTIVPSYEQTEMPLTDSVMAPASTNALYVIDANMEQIGTIADLAPGERVYSVRFMGETGYFVTYRETDPLFSIDLSDPADPKVMDALKIPGFSSYLHFYSKDLLLGLGEEFDPGTGEFLGLKLSMFDISDPYNILEVDKTVLPDSYYSTALNNHKALLIDPERNLIGFYVESYHEKDYEYEESYELYAYVEGSGFQKLFHCDVGNNPILTERDYPNLTNIRGLYIGDFLYLVYGNRICSYSLDTFDPIEGLIISGDGKHTHEIYTEIR